MDELVAHSGAALSIHGHFHSSADYQIGSTRVICNPHGSVELNPTFDPGLAFRL